MFEEEDFQQESTVDIYPLPTGSAVRILTDLKNSEDKTIKSGSVGFVTERFPSQTDEYNILFEPCGITVRMSETDIDNKGEFLPVGHSAIPNKDIRAVSKICAQIYKDENVVNNEVLIPAALVKELERLSPLLTLTPIGVYVDELVYGAGSDTEGGLLVSFEEIDSFAQDIGFTDKNFSEQNSSSLGMKN